MNTRLIKIIILLSMISVMPTFSVERNVADNGASAVITPIPNTQVINAQPGGILQLPAEDAARRELALKFYKKFRTAIINNDIVQLASFMHYPLQIIPSPTYKYPQYLEPYIIHNADEFIKSYNRIFSTAMRDKIINNSTPDSFDYSARFFRVENYTFWDAESESLTISEIAYEGPNPLLYQLNKNWEKVLPVQDPAILNQFVDLYNKPPRLKDLYLTRDTGKCMFDSYHDTCYTLYNIDITNSGKNSFVLITYGGSGGFGGIEVYNEVSHNLVSVPLGIVSSMGRDWYNFFGDPPIVRNKTNNHYYIRFNNNGVRCAYEWHGKNFVFIEGSDECQKI